MNAGEIIKNAMVHALRRRRMKLPLEIRIHDVGGNSMELYGTDEEVRVITPGDFDRPVRFPLSIAVTDAQGKEESFMFMEGSGCL